MQKACGCLLRPVWLPAWLFIRKVWAVSERERNKFISSVDNYRTGQSANGQAGGGEGRGVDVVVIQGWRKWICMFSAKEPGLVKYNDPFITAPPPLVFEVVCLVGSHGEETNRRGKGEGGGRWAPGFGGDDADSQPGRLGDICLPSDDTHPFTTLFLFCHRSLCSRCLPACRCI